MVKAAATTTARNHIFEDYDNDGEGLIKDVVNNYLHIAIYKLYYHILYSC